MSSAPKIGITCDYELAVDRRGMPSPRFVLSASYVAAVLAAGGQPWPLPHRSLHNVDLMAELDGIIISGGDFDIPPSYYGAEPRPTCGPTLPARSAFERHLCQEALSHDMPMLGICGGMQLMCVVMGGTLYQDLSEREDTDEHVQPKDKSQPFHTVALRPNTLVAKAYGADATAANSTHHQVVHSLGPNTRASGHTADGVIEAIEITGQTFALGLQWHPEAMVVGVPAHPEHLGPYRSLIVAAHSFAERRRAAKAPHGP
ncbi:hypothetical protein Q3G72_015579 [Acer saccharum]|nr:hypothetical protein Q3G72_015579 [Acer saccharum]